MASLLAGPLGGALYAVAHAVPLAGAAIGHAATAVCTWLVREPLNGDVEAARATRPLAALREGLRFVWSVPLFRALLGLFVVINVAFGSLMVGINLELVRTRTAPVLIGLVDLAVGVGVLVGAVLAPRLVARVRAGRSSSRRSACSPRGPSSWPCWSRTRRTSRCCLSLSCSSRP